MDSGERRFGRGDRLVSEVIDGEAIIIKLSDGTYYSMDGVGAVIWEWLAAGATPGELVDEVIGRFDVRPEEARAGVETLLAALSREHLISPLGLVDSTVSREPARRVERRAYAPPVLNVHHDMADLLALDPPTPGVLDHLLQAPADRRPG